MKLKTSDRLATIGEYYFSGKLREIEMMNSQGAKVINLGVGSPDLPPHPDVIRTLQKQVSNPGMHAYQGYRGSAELRKAFSNWYQNWYGVSLDHQTEILPLMGSKEGIMHICMTYVDEGDEVLVPDPGYPTYSRAVKLAGGICREYLLHEGNGFHPDICELQQYDLKKIRLMFINYPHMPSGTVADKNKLQELIFFAEENQILLINDNPYSFIQDGDPFSLLSLAGAKDVVIELNSLSKSHSMAGWRIGMMAGVAQHIEEVMRFRTQMDSGMFLPLQLAAAKALSLDKTWYDSINEIYRKRRSKAEALLHNIPGCCFREGQAGLFVWARIPPEFEDGFAFSDKLLERFRLFFTPGGIFGSQGKDFIRLSLCSREEIFDEAINRIRASWD